ncbi:RNA polymerase sigma-70 factor [Anditalea andensis]|uniref:RNA polymerase sigma-70 factor n=1 Tax=Anditalea andensis TaxID=1048983 RepID=A0A074LDR2_9BACT|nr:RNA polymerase sigma-70 factor [Anditalea andensis]KEO71937.1 hypothetical protein EL17_20690 [Anditalea andensis]
MKTSENNLLNVFKNGDRKSFELIFERYWDPLFLHALKKTGHPQEAEDIVQDIFVDLWNNRTRISIHTNIESYLFTAVKYKFYKSVRDQKISIRSIDGLDLQIENMEGDFELEEAYEKIYHSIEMLPAKCREVFKLSRYDRLSSKEIAEKLGLSPQTVNNRISMSLSIIKDELKDFPLLVCVFFFS